MQKGTSNPRREIPATRVAAFIRHYIDAHIETHPEVGDHGLTQFSFEAGVDPRWLYRVLSGETANVSFDRLDDMLVALDRNYLWTWDPQDGGFSDYYADEPGPAAPKTIEQQRRNEVLMAKRHARNLGADWVEVLMDRARNQMELQCA